MPARGFLPERVLTLLARSVPANCRFEVDDCEDEWTWTHGFDYIHSRFMCGAITDWPRLMRNCWDSLNPGGWIEYQDYYVKMQCIDDSLAGTALERWNNLLLEGAGKMGRNPRCVAHFKKQMRQAGYVDVVERKFVLPGNPWARGREEKRLGAMQMTNILDGLHGISMSLFTKVHGMPTDEVETLLEEARKDLADTNIHFYYIV